MAESTAVSSNSNKRRIQEIDGRIEFLSHEIHSLEDFVSKSQLECSLMSVKLKREKVKALTALAKSKALLADMEVLVAESDLLLDLEKLKSCKRIKLDCDAGKSQQAESQEKPKSTNKSIAVQTSKSSVEKKKRKHSTSKSSKSIDISSDDTVIIPLLETHQTSKTETLVTHFNIDLIKKSSTPHSSDSEASLSSSLKAEFEKPYKTDKEKSEKKNEPEKRTKGKSDKKNTSKNKNNSTQQTQSPSTSTRPKTVAELKARSVEQINNSIPAASSPTANTSRQQSTDRNPVPSTSTFVPIRHNMPQIVTQSHGLYVSRLPQTTSSHVAVQNPTYQTNFTYYNEPRNAMVLQSHPFYRKNL
uniref:Uncharacterized protein n=1 Tax=Heliothis virescens TaxID=7102 RepID=A0A2A4JBI9_HELVI